MIVVKELIVVQMAEELFKAHSIHNRKSFKL